MPNNNFNNSSINGNLIPNAQKGMQFNTPLSRFGPVRSLMVLEFTPLESVGKFGEPVRFPFFINPQSISFSQEPSFSQQQTRGGWVHTHWNDKPLMMKIHGNSGLYQMDFINVLRWYVRVSGKTYLELDTEHKNKNIYKDKFLSEFLSPNDAKKLLSILNNTNLPAGQNTPNGRSYGQSILQGLVTSGALYQQAKTVGKIAFTNIQLASTVENSSKSILSLNSDLNLTKQQSQNSQATNQNFNQNGQAVLKGSSINQNNIAPQSDVSIKGVFQKLGTIPTNRITDAGFFSSPVDTMIANPYGLAGVFGTIPIFNDNILISPGGIISAPNQVNSDAILKSTFSTPESRFLQLSENVISNFASNNMRLENPMQILNTNLRGINSDLDFLLGYSSTLSNKGKSIISTLSLNDDIITNITILNEFLASFSAKIVDIQDDLVVLERKIKIQTKRFDSEQERKLFKKLNQKREALLQDINTLFTLKSNVDNLIMEPLAISPDTTNQANKGADLLMSDNNTQFTLKYLNARHPELSSGTLSSSEISTIAQTELTNLYKNPNPGLTVSPQLQAGAANLFTAFHVQNKLPLNPSDISNIPGANQNQFGNLVRDQISQISSSTISKIDTNSANTATSAPNSFPQIMNQLGVASKNIEEKIQGNFSISDSPIVPTYNDVVKIKLYYSGTIYEGFFTHFDWQEQASTPNIEYDMEFLVEKEFLSSSLSLTPSSLQSSPQDVRVFTGGDGINPIIGASSIPITTVTGRIISGTQQSNTVGSSNPQPFPAIGSIPVIPTSPLPGAPGNKVNIPVKNFGTTDSSSLTQNNVNTILQEGQLDLPDTF